MKQLEASLLIDFAALAISFAALAVAIVVGKRERRTAAHLLEIEKAREVDRVADRGAAQLTARVESSEPRGPGSGRRFHIALANKGQSQASDIEIFFDETPVQESSVWIRGSPPPPRVLAPGGQVDLAITITMGMRDRLPETIVCRWLDDAGGGESENPFRF